MSNTVPLQIRMGALTLGFQDTPQALADAIAERLEIITEQQLALFVRGSAEPSSDVGPWLDTSTNPGRWKVFDYITGQYVPIGLDSLSLRYILATAAPDQTKYDFWIELNGTGKSIAVKTYSGGAWKDVYEDRFATITSQITSLQTGLGAVLPTPYGAAGTFLQSTGPGNDLVWASALPTGVCVMWPNGTPPAGWLLCDGTIHAMATYPALGALCGSAFGGDGINTFGVPDMRGRSPTGFGTGDADYATAWALGQKKGREKHQLIESELPIHKAHTPLSRGNADGNDFNTDQGLLGRLPAGPAGTYTADSNDIGSDDPHDTLGPRIGIGFIIRT